MNKFLLLQLSFIVLTLSFSWLLFIQLRKGILATALPEHKKIKTLNRMVLLWVSWIIFVSAWSLTGTMGNFEIFPFNFAPILIVPLVVITYLSFFSNTTGELLDHLKPHVIIRLQVFRVFVEILLWMLLLENLLPIQMSFEGRNFDILAGLTAPLIAYLSYHQKISKTIIIVWNVVSLGLLINIVTIAILSMPAPFRVFLNEPSNIIVAQFPISLLPGFLVPLAYALHFLSIRQLSRIRN
jgi:hypothetical protein